MSEARQEHWEKVYGTKATTDVSWYEPRPDLSLDLIRASGIRPSDPIIDVGGGASLLVDELVSAGYSDVTVLDISDEVLKKVAERTSAKGHTVRLIRSDITEFTPARQYTLWHDRAVFHFLVGAEDRERYRSALGAGVARGGFVVIATFGPQGPERCSGLPVARYDAAALSAELGADFRLLSSQLKIHRTPWGAEQQFQYCLFSRIA